MKRTKANQNNNDPRWERRGGGVSYLRIRGRLHIIKPGQRFYAPEEDVHDSFRDVIVQIADGKKTKQKTSSKSSGKKSSSKTSAKKGKADKSGNYKIVPAEGDDGKFNVVDVNKKVVNQKPLEPEQANKLLDDLTATE